MGVVAGVPDLAFVLPDGRAAFFEVKTRTGRLSPQQIAFRDRCNAVGAPYAMARSVEVRRRSAFSQPGAAYSFLCGLAKTAGLSRSSAASARLIRQGGAGHYHT